MANSALDFSPDDRRLVVGGPDGSLTLYDLAAGGEARSLPAGAVVTSVRFHPHEGKLAAGRPDGSVTIYETSSTRILRQRSVGSGVGTLDWHPSGQWLAVGCSDLNIQLFDADLSQLLAVLQGHVALPCRLAFTHQGNLLASYGADHTLRLWHPLGGTPLLTLSAVFLADAPVFTADDRRMAYTMMGSRLTVYELDGASECREFMAEPLSSERLWHTDISKDGSLLAGACGDGVRIWDCRHGRQVAYLPGREWRTGWFTSDGSLIVGGWPGIRRWVIPSGEPPEAVVRQAGSVERLPFIPEGPSRWCALGKDGDLVAFDMGDVVAVFDLKARCEKMRVPAPVGLSQVSLSRDGRWLALATWHGAGIRVFDLQRDGAGNHQPVFTQEDNDSGVGFSPDNKWLVSATATEYRLWSVGHWVSGLRIPRRVGSGIPGPLTFNSTGSIIAIVPAWNVVQLIDVPTGHELASLEIPDVRERIQTLSFSPDDSFLAVGGIAHKLHVWDLRLVRRRLASMGLDWTMPASLLQPTRPDRLPTDTIGGDLVGWKPPGGSANMTP